MARKSYGILVGVLSLFTLNTYAFAQSPEYDVLGIKLGSLPQDIDKNTTASGIKIYPQDMRLKLGLFTSDVFHFGAAVSNSQNYMCVYSVICSDPDREFLAIVYDSREPQKVIGIKRNYQYANGKSPTLAVFRQAFVDKYGNPDNVIGWGHNHEFTEMIWSKDSQMVPNRGSSLCLPILDKLTEIGRGFYPSVFNEGNLKCGSWIHVIAFPNRGDKEEVLGFQLSVGDVTAIYSSYMNINSILTAGAAQAAAAEKAKAEGNKTKL